MKNIVQQSQSTGEKAHREVIHSFNFHRRRRDNARRAMCDVTSLARPGYITCYYYRAGCQRITIAHIHTARRLLFLSVRTHSQIMFMQTRNSAARHNNKF